MRHTLLYICTLIFISSAGFGQKQVTDLRKQEYRGNNQSPLGQIGNNFYILNPNHSISKIDLKNESISSFYKFPVYEDNFIEAVLTSKKELFFYNVNSINNKITINQIDFNTANSKIVFELENAQHAARVGEKIYSKVGNVLVRLDLASAVLKADTVIRSYLSHSFSGSNYIFSYSNENGIFKTGFIDERNNFFEEDGLPVGNHGQSFGDYLVFSYLNYSSSSFTKIYNKKTGSLINLPDSLVRYDIYNRFFFYEDQLYFMSNQSGEQYQKYTLYRVVEDKITKIFSTDLKNRQFINMGMFSPSLWQISNSVLSDNWLYFVSSSFQSSANNPILSISGINLKTSENVEYVLPEQNFENPPYPLDLELHNDSLIVHLNKNNFSNVLFDLKSKTFTENTQAVNLSKSVTLADSTIISYSYFDKIIILRLDKDMKILDNVIYDEKSSIDQVFYGNNNIYIFNYGEQKVTIYNGESLDEIKHEIPDLKVISYFKVFEAGYKDSFLIRVHGTDYTGKAKEMFFSFREQKFQLLYTFEGLSSFDEGHNKREKDRFLYIPYGDKKGLITDLSKENTFHYTSDFDYSEVVHSFSNNTFILSDWEQVVYWNPQTNIRKNLFKYPYGDFTSRMANDIAYFSYENKIITIDKSGNTAVVLDNISSSWFDHNIVYYKRGTVGMLNILNGRKIEFESGGVPSFNVFKSGDNYYGTYDSKLYYLDFTNRKVHRLGLANVNYLDIGNEWAFFKEYEKGDWGNFWAINKSEVRKIFQGNLYELYAPNKPSILSGNSEDKKLLWIPDSLAILEIQNPLFQEYSSHEFIKRIGSSFYFLTRDSENRRFLLVIDSEKRKSQIQNPINYQSNYYAYFNNDLYYTNDSGVWTTKNSDASHLSSLIVPPYFNGNIFIEFKNKLYGWLKDNYGVSQLYELTEKDEEDILLSSEDPAVNFSFYPNPTQDFLNVSSTSETENKYKITVFSTDGKVLSEQSLELPQKLDLSNLKEGTYLINVRARKENKTFRVVRN
jgi:hypothetical protein